MGKTHDSLLVDTKKLTLKQRKFLDVYLETGNATTAAMQACY